MAPYRTYAVSFAIKRGALPDALYWDTLDPYHYVRLQPHSTEEVFVIIGGEDHKSGEADDGEERFAALEHWARERLPDMGAITHRWSGQVLEPIDFVGFIGRSPDEEHVFIVSGDSGQGITNGLVAGILIADLITTGSSPWDDIYSPARTIHKNLGEYISENITPLKNFAEYLSADEIASVDRLRPGEGCLVRSGLQKVAACRDQKGQLHLHSASCTHLGCVVHWTHWSNAGIAHATDRSSHPMAPRSMDLQYPHLPSSRSRRTTRPRNSFAWPRRPPVGTLVAEACCLRPLFWC
jgi:hypothetical protein